MKHAIVRLSVDGSLLNYHMRVSADDEISTNKSTIFNGFREGYNTYKAFVFARPDDTGDGDNQSLIGQLKVEIYEALITPDLHNTPPGYDYSAPPVQTSKTDPENKKPTECPTLATTSGRFITCGRPATGPSNPCMCGRDSQRS